MKTKDHVNSNPSDQHSEGRARDGGAANSLGEQLRQARQRRGTSLREISDHTRISMQYLEAIETDDYKRLPGGIFNRSFIKAYARHIGFDEQEALELYARTAREHGESFDEVATSPVRSRIYTDGDSSRSPLLTAFLSALIVGILVLGVYAGLHFYRRTESNSGQPTPLPSPASSATTNGTLAPQGQQQQGGTLAPVNAANAFQIQVKAKEEVWLRTRMDEDRQTDATLNANQTREFTPQNRLSIWYSKSKKDALEVSINGQIAQAPAAAAAAKGALVEWVITRDDYRQFLP